MLKKKNSHKILFVCHMASISGAPLLLLEIIKDFKKKSTIPFNILIIKDGDLREQFEFLGKTFVWDFKLKEPTILLSSRVINLFNKVKQKILQAYILFCIRDTSLVFLNTMSNGAVQKRLLFLKCKFICYVHELQAAIHIVSTTETVKVIIDNTDLFIACSNAVKQNLINNYDIKKDDIRLLNTSLSEVYRNKNDFNYFINFFKHNNNIPAGAIIIGSIGGNEWRKGFDLFFPLINVYFNLFPEADTYFVWKGFNKENTSSYFDLYDLKMNKNKGKILLLPHGKDGIETIACIDIYLLLSREDPYPLVVLEAASFGIPSVCFSDSGGSSEFIEQDSGYCVPYGDLISMAASLHKLAQDAGLRNKMGLNAQEKVIVRHAKYNTMPEFIKILEN